jgi:hypothetical protein
MRRLALILLGACALALPASATAATTVQRIPFETDVTACNGDTVHISGTLLETDSVTTTPAGGFTVAFHFQPQGISGVDQQTGVRFQATGLTRDLVVVTPAGGYAETFVNRFHIQATTGAQSFDVSETLHITVTPSGSVSVSFDNFSSTC